MVDFEKLMKKPLRETNWTVCPKCGDKYSDLYISQHMMQCKGNRDAY